MEIDKYISAIDREGLRDQIRQAQPFPHCVLDNFLVPDFADRVLESFPSFEDAVKVGRLFSAVNERGKVQVTDSSVFPKPVSELNQVLASDAFRGLLSYAFDIPRLLADEELAGGGIHQTGSRGHLDVHVDFNYLKERDLHRRLNILVYFNKDWADAWGGNIELWDREVKVCHRSMSPVFNRCVIFATSDISFHGVSAVKCPEGMSRKSFAAYYYTREAPANWTGEEHSTIFKARPDEAMKRHVLMPLENAQRRVTNVLQSVKDTLRKR